MSLLIYKFLVNDLFLFRKMRFFVLKTFSCDLFCLHKIFCLIVCRLVLIYPVDCLCGVITRSYFSLFNSQLCNMIVCFFF